MRGSHAGDPRNGPPWPRRSPALQAIGLMVAACTLIGCSSGSSATPATSASSATTATTTVTTPASTAPTSIEAPASDPAAAKAMIIANWEKFFSPTTTIDQRAALLENGEQYRQALIVRSRDPLQKQASAKVTAVVLSPPDQAMVTYDVSLNGQVALPNAQGVAVLQDGVWKVTDNTFCALISLGATAPIPGCS